MTTAITAPNVDRILLNQSQMMIIEHFTGVDNFMWRAGQRRIRPSSSPDFKIGVQYKNGDYTEHDACVVASNAPLEGGIEPGSPIAIAMVTIDGEDWYMLISIGQTVVDTSLYVSEVMIAYDGDPEELFQKTHLFDTE